MKHEYFDGEIDPGEDRQERYLLIDGQAEIPAAPRIDFEAVDAEVEDKPDQADQCYRCQAQINGYLSVQVFLCLENKNQRLPPPAKPKNPTSLPIIAY